MVAKRSSEAMAARHPEPPSLPAQPGTFGIRGYRIRHLAQTKERRRAILTGAARAFAHGGYDATNMDQIARECGLAKGHIYHYFRSKEEIFTEIRVDVMSRILDELTALTREGGDDQELV